MTPNEGYEPVIGLEVHAQLLTASKAFCGCSTKFGDEPNTNVCPVCAGLPGVLPVLNINLVEFALRMGLAANSTIAPRSTFARKNYFYPDLPKGYQISQYEEPICTGGFVEIDLDDGGRKKIRLTRIHMEEDAGKLIHDAGAETLVDLNRSGVPLIEIVSEPDLRSPKEASLYLHKIRQIVTHLGICDGNMEEGSLRCDANVSVRKKGDSGLGTKTELKNMNSFRNVERALEFEIDRQIRVLEEGGSLEQETLLWDVNRNIAYSMRSKEEAHDYRYFPDPDLVPVHVDEPWIRKVRAGLPEHPTARRDRFIKEHHLPKYDADVLTSEKGYGDYFEAVVKALGPANPEDAKSASNWVMTEVLRVVGEQKLEIGKFPISPARIASMIRLINDGTISSKIAKDVFAEMLHSDEDPKAIVEKKGMVQLSDESAIRKVVDEVADRNEAQVKKYRAGNANVFGFFVGEVMKATKGKANPAIVNKALKKRLDTGGSK
ncbi:MAG TPA: Asp-tRNA(Asn)/Glu-tRNA(Gln) amidotransferase subunit GatB [Bacteroidota bacterium]|nr:Asp-tRNA(Asn)/Glu-tRNA(Gln) amidotransferase subunit GatB [Bacteroidota bacterium]